MARDRGARIELLRYQVGELEALGLAAGEAQALIEERNRLANRGRLAEGAQGALALCYEGDGNDAHALAARATGMLRSAAALDPRIEPALALARGIADCAARGRLAACGLPGRARCRSGAAGRGRAPGCRARGPCAQASRRGVRAAFKARGTAVRTCDARTVRSRAGRARRADCRHSQALRRRRGRAHGRSSRRGPQAGDRGDRPHAPARHAGRALRDRGRDRHGVGSAVDGRRSHRVPREREPRRTAEGRRESRLRRRTVPHQPRGAGRLARAEAPAPA